MGTPEKGKNSQIATPASKFEDSPVFNFLNNLSPIKQVKSTHISQSINPLTFASLPSVFTSPHVSSLAESRFLRRHQLSDPSKPEFSSDDASIFDTSTINMDGKENLDPRASNSEQSYESSKVVIPFVENVGDYASNSSTLVPFVNEASQRDLFRNEMNPQGIISQLDQNNEATSCDWDSLIANSEFLVFESPNDGESYDKKPVDPATSFYTSIKNAMQNMSTQLGEGSEIMENEHHLSGSSRGMKGRRLVFEMGGSHRKHLQESAKSDSFVLLQPDSNTIVNQQLGPKKTGKLPSIGLHLNALAATPKDYKIVNYEASSSGRLIIGQSPLASFDHHPTSSQELLTNALVVSSLDREIDSVENGELLVDDVCQAIGYMANDEINQSISPKKKRRKEQAGEGESCKRCNCKKSKCLKLYCECFAAGVYCVEPCACIDCFNKPIHEDTVLATRKQIESRNPLAFAPKVIRGSDSPSEMGEDSSKTPASARHKRGCNCKKSGCLKKYCECYQGGVGCSINCRCEACRNVFGRKDGCGAIGNEGEFEEDETNSVDKTLLDRTFHKTGTHNDIEKNMVSAPPATPKRAGRQLIQPFSSKKKPPRSTFCSISSSSSSQSNFLQPRPKFDNHFKNVLEDEMPEFLQSVSPIKSSSPNGKRVFSSPQGVEKSPSLRSSRKLILRSIPSFPSLTNNQ